MKLNYYYWEQLFQSIVILINFLDTFVYSRSYSTVESPELIHAITNVTVATGRDTVLECTVNNLGNYKVAWLKLETIDGGGSGVGGGGGSGMGRSNSVGNLSSSSPSPLWTSSSSSTSSSSEYTLLTIQTQTVVKDHRFRVTHTNYRQWYLHIKSVRAQDKGWYMCQINTDPMLTLGGYVDVLIPPSIVDSDTSSDTAVDERQRLSLRCRANGYPQPTITWRREDNKDINLGLYGGKKYSAAKVEGEYLNISQLTRDDMGAYLCIASNSVPPSVSQRIIVRVNFRPKIKVLKQLIGSSVGSDVNLECYLEASPQPITLWMRSTDGQVLMPSPKYQTREEHDSYRTRMLLKITGLDDKDFGSYKCVAKNSLGEKEGLVRLYEVQMPTNSELASSVWPPSLLSPAAAAAANNNNNNHQNGSSSMSSSSMMGDNTNKPYDNTVGQVSSSATQ
ncbi:lachesin-like, partial [Oppia nitens]|uniref:lachesin-like n=1 Tax=Oppia nitens TaxID=1686743 RepID=UPI0023DCC531